MTTTGQPVRKFQVQRPSEDAQALDMKGSIGGKLAFLFGEPANGQATQRQVISIVNAETGETEINYEPGTDTGAALACYTPNRFTFIGSTDDGHLALKHAVPQ
jgi:hypothetical protein